MKVGIVTAVIAVGVTAPWVVQHQTHSQLTKASQELSQRNAELSHLAQENERLSNLVAQASVAAPAPTTNPSAEVLKLRGEVGRLRQETIAAESGRTNAPSALSGLRENPGMWKLIRDQQKAGMGIIYKDFAKRVNLDKEQGEKLTEVLADNVMENVDRITEVLRDRKSPEEADAVFAAQEAVLAEKIQALLGPEGATQYHEFTKNLASHLTAQQFKGMMTGEQEAKDAKAKQLYELMLAETQRTLASAGLPPDFQTVPNLNFRNFASETEAEKNLKLLEGIYDRVADQAGAFLDSEEIGKFAQFRTTAVNNNRMALALNRKLMAPGGGGK